MNNKIKQVCKELGISMSELSFRARIALPVLSNIANGKMFAYPKYRASICQATGYDESYIFPEL